MRELVTAAKVVRRSRERVLARHGASLPTWIVLYCVTDRNPPSQRDLARMMDVEGPTLTRHLDRLEEEGLIVRTRSTRDRRVVHVEPTAKGHALVEQMQSVAVAADERLLEGIDPEELATYRAVIGRLVANAEAEEAADDDAV